MRVLLVDDHELVRIGLRDVLRTIPSVEVVGESGTVVEALAQVQALQPDIVLLDMRLPDGNGADACQKIRATLPSARVIMVTGFADEVVSAIRAGASAYVVKTGVASELVEALRQVGQGQTYMSPSVTSVVFDHVKIGSDAEHPRWSAVGQLTDQHKKILDLIEDGKTNVEIGESLNISEHTVKVHVKDLMTRLGVRHRSQLAAINVRIRNSSKA